MSNQNMIASSKKAIALIAIAASGSLIGLPVFAGGTTADSSKKPASITEAAPTDVTKPTVPSVSSPAPASPTSATPAADAPTKTPSVTTPASPTSVDPSVRPMRDTTATPAKTPASPTAAATGTIVDVASANNAFETLIAAAKAAGMTGVLSSQGPYTVFAPTDEAFAALPKGTIEALLKPENKAKLQKILGYHVLSGAVESSAIKPGQVQTVQGKPINVRMMGNQIMVNDARVTSADIKASNGVIHVIDKVILPPDL
jgi:uncharacterized surface protein with fasciclin (FAS1) repeats